MFVCLNSRKVIVSNRNLLSVRYREGFSKWSIDVHIPVLKIVYEGGKTSDMRTKHLVRLMFKWSPDPLLDHLRILYVWYILGMLLAREAHGDMVKLKKRSAVDLPGKELVRSYRSMAFTSTSSNCS